MTCKTDSRAPLCVAAAAAAVLCAPAFANPTGFDDRGVWQAAAGGGVVIETFENEPLGALGNPTTLISGLGVGRFNGSAGISIEAGDPDSFGLENTTFNGRKYLRYGESGDTGSYTAQFLLPEDVTAWGADVSGWQPFDAGGGAGQGGANITLLLEGQIVHDFFYQSDADLAVTFVGFVSDQAFDEVRFGVMVLPSDGIADYAAFDQVSWAAVPAPGSVALVGGAGVLALRRRRA